VLPFAPMGKVGREHFLALPGAMLGRHPPARPATHRPARPAPRCGVTAPPVTPLTKGGESPVIHGGAGEGWSSPPSIPRESRTRGVRREACSPPFGAVRCLSTATSWLPARVTPAPGLPPVRVQLDRPFSGLGKRGDAPARVAAVGGLPRCCRSSGADAVPRIRKTLTFFGGPVRRSRFVPRVMEGANPGRHFRVRTFVLAFLIAAPLAGQAEISQEERTAILQGRSCAGRNHQSAWACSLWLGEPHEVTASKAALTAAARVADAVEAAELEEVERFEVSLRIAAQSLEASLYFAGSACADKLPAEESWATIGDFASGSIIPAYGCRRGTVGGPADGEQRRLRGPESGPGESKHTARHGGCAPPSVRLAPADERIFAGIDRSRCPRVLPAGRIRTARPTVSTGRLPSGSEGARPPASLRRGRTECGPKGYADHPRHESRQDIT
jgi:hypothetical protein